MLVLVRRIGETIMIGPDVTVTVVDVHGQQARLGINAPKNIPIHRKEVFERIKREMSGGEVNDVQDPGTIT